MSSGNLISFGDTEWLLEDRKYFHFPIPDQPSGNMTSDVQSSMTNQHGAVTSLFVSDGMVHSGTTNSMLSIVATNPVVHVDLHSTQHREDHLYISEVSVVNGGNEIAVTGVEVHQRAHVD